MRVAAWRWPAALIGGLLAGCSQVTLLHQEIHDVDGHVHLARKDISDLQKSVDDLNLRQGGSTSKMRADLTTMLDELQTQIRQLHSDIDETQHRLLQLSQKLDKLDQRKIVVSGTGSAVTAGSDTAAAATGPTVKVVDALDIDNLFNQSREDYIRGKYELSYQEFKTVYDKDAGGSYKEVSLYWMAECLMQGNKPDRALEMYQRVLKEFPKGTKACAARFKAGLIYDQQKDLDKRNETWKLLIAECPESNEADRARDMMKP